MSSKSKGMHDKRQTLKDAVAKYVKDGINIGIGGFVNTRVPVAAIHEIIRHGARDLTLSLQSNSICAELLAGAMVLDPDRISIKRVELAWWGYEVIGIAPLLRHLTSKGMIQLDDYTNYGMSARFKAAAMGIPFLPTRDHGGSDMKLVNRGTMVACPFSGKNVYLVPACHPDVAIVHVTAADMYGNCRIFGAHCTCPEITMAATHSIVTTECRRGRPDRAALRRLSGGLLWLPLVLYGPQKRCSVLSVTIFGRRGRKTVCRSTMTNISSDVKPMTISSRSSLTKP